MIENQSIKFSLDIYPTAIILIYADTVEDCAKIAFKSYNLELSYDSSVAAVTNMVGKHIIIALPHKEYEEHPEYLVHECLHAAAYCIRYIGAPISSETEEILAYTQQHIYKRCLDAIKEMNKNVNQS